MLKTIFQRLNTKQYVVSGDIKFNGVLSDNVQRLNELIGFTRQDEVFLTALTVNRTISFIIDLALNHLPENEKQQRVTKLTELSLTCFFILETKYD